MANVDQGWRIDHDELSRWYEKSQHDLAVSEQGRLRAEEMREYWMRCAREQMPMMLTEKLDRYRQALERIAGFDHIAGDIARAALRETEPEETNDLPGEATEPGPDWRQA